MSDVYLLLGSNEGSRLLILQQALMAIGDTCGAITALSSVYETDAWGKEDQPPFLNLVAQIQTELAPEDLLRRTQQIEHLAGRERRVKWGQRTLDIDVLFYDDLVIQTEFLVIPHPRLHLRRFTLAPLAEIAPDHVHPQLKQNSLQLLKACSDPLAVRVTGNISMP